MRARFNLVAMAVLALAVVVGCGDSPSAIIQLDDGVFLLDFGVARPDAVTTRSLTVEKPFQADAIVTEIASVGPFFPAVGSLPANSGTGLVYQFLASFNPALLTGLTGDAEDRVAMGTITLRYEEIGGGRTIEQVCRLTAIVESPSIELTTETITFGKTALGETASSVVQVRNPNVATPVRIDTATITDTSSDPNGQGKIDVNLTGLPLEGGNPLIIPPGESRRVPVEFAPTVDGAVSSATVILNTAVGEGLLAGNDFDTQLTTDVSGEGMVGEVVVREFFGPTPLDDGTPLVLDGNGESPEYKFDLPAETVSFSIVAFDSTFGAGFERPIQILLLKGPGDKEYTDRSSGTSLGPWDWFRNKPNGDTSADYISPNVLNVISTQLPNSDNPEAQLVPGGGEYCLRFSGSPGATLTFRLVYEQRNAGQVSEGTIDLNIMIPTGGSIPFDAMTGPANPIMQSILAEGDRILSSAGIRIGEVVFWDLTFLDGGGMPTDNLPGQADIERNFANTSGATDENAVTFLADLATNRERLNVFLPNSLGGGPGIDASALGISGGIPVPKNTTIIELSYSGIAIQYGGTPAARVGRELARQIMHALGVPDTTPDGILDDGIMDTTTCPLTETNDNCPVLGNNYLLFPVDLGPGGTVITPGQRRVATRNPILRPGRNPGLGGP